MQASAPLRSRRTRQQPAAQGLRARPRQLAGTGRPYVLANPSIAGATARSWSPPLSPVSESSTAAHWPPSSHPRGGGLANLRTARESPSRCRPPLLLAPARRAPRSLQTPPGPAEGCRGRDGPRRPAVAQFSMGRGTELVRVPVPLPPTQPGSPTPQLADDGHARFDFCPHQPHPILLVAQPGPIGRKIG